MNRLSLASIFTAACLTFLSPAAPLQAAAQSAAKPDTPAVSASPAAPSSQSDQPPAGQQGKVLFSRSTADSPAGDPQPDDPHAVEGKTGDGKAVASKAAEAKATSPAAASSPKAPATRPLDPAAAKQADEEREAVAITAYDLDIRLFPHQQSLAVRAKLTLRNDGTAPLQHLRLQLSSTLKWERILIGGKAAIFKPETLPSDADHTGAVTEAVIDLPTPLDPKSSLTADATYSGQIIKTAARLQHIGTPADIAQQSDWDEISDDAVALRGFGNVLWYPVSALPVALGDGAKYFTEVGRQQLHQTGATFQVAVTQEFTGEPPSLAVIDGHIQPVAVSAAPTESYPGVVTSTLARTTLSFVPPSLFLLRRTEDDGDDVAVYTIRENHGNPQNYLAAAALVDPLIHQWLGGRPKTPLAVIELPDAGDTPFESGAALFTGIGAVGVDPTGAAASPKTAPGAASPPSSPPASQDTQRLAPTLSHALSHAYFQSPRPWLDEGLAHFLAGEWLAQSKGRELALEALEPQREALALAEPGSPGEAHGQSLIEASDTIYYRTKAAYVLGMLRDIVGDSALSSALRAYAPGADTRPEYFEGLVEKAGGKDLRWFFDAWVYADQGLPDLSIARVFSSRTAEPGQYLVTIDVANEGYAEVEVPVTVRSADTSVTDRVRVPGRGKTTHRILLKGQPSVVEVNDGSIPEVQATFHRHTLSR